MFIKSTLKWVGIALLQVTIFQPVMADESAINSNPKDTGVFTIGAQIRPRFEYRHGFKKPFADTLKAAGFVEQRSRIWFDYANSKFHIRLNLQDIRMWGSTSQIYKADPSMFNAYEAYGEYFINKNWAFKVGRQAIDYDNARFYGNLDWAAQGRSHDAFILKYKDDTKKLKVHAGIAYNQLQNEPKYLSFSAYGQNNYKMMAYAWAHKDWGKLSTSILFNNDGREKIADSSIVNNQTIGLIPTYKNDKWKVGAEVYYQMGKNVSDQDISAYFIALNFTYKTDLTPITIGVDYASGTAHDADAKDNNSWSPLYGTNHKFYGFMDYFYVGNPHGQGGRNTGLIDVYGKLKFKLGQTNKHSLLTHVHYFMSPVELLDLTDVAGTKTVSSGLGTEIDLVYKVILTKGVSANVGYSQMFATDSMKQIKGMADLVNGYAKTGTNNWMWLQINFATDLFNFKK
jgi:hypothetical protein